MHGYCPGTPSDPRDHSRDRRPATRPVRVFNVLKLGLGLIPYISRAHANYNYTIKRNLLFEPSFPGSLQSPASSADEDRESSLNVQTMMQA